ncbi:hypothetical protein WA026_017359 [Henosepilachna vigintioctopunctata]|uniref:Endonuclease-reverse transcriptase n=1 Tax=Henosepilachna vigintioctopunctata TaxID=420089 RepID=A0AAW1VGP2_9CUCU
MYSKGEHTPIEKLDMTSDAYRDITLRKIYEEIISSKQEIKNTIADSEARLLLEIQELKIRVNALEEENSELKNNIEFAERKLNRKNLVIFGLKKSGAEISLSYVCKELNRLLDVEIAESDVSDCFPLGNGQNCPVKIELLTNIKKRQIFSNLRKLKGTGIAVSHDLTRKQREELHEEEYTLKELERDIEDHQSNGAPPAPQPKGKKGQEDNDENFRRDNGTQYDVKKNTRSQNPNKPTTATKLEDSKKIYEANLVPRLGMKLRKGSDQ